METASFPEEERRGKDIVDSGTGFVRSGNLVAPIINPSNVKTNCELREML